MLKAPRPPKPGELAGPMGLPASYAKYQLVKYGFREGKFVSGSARHFMKLDNGDWEEIKYPLKGYGALSAPRK